MANTVRIEGEDHSFEWDKEQSLLEALLAADIPAPYGCEEGECGACQCKVTGSDTHMAKNYVLDQDDIEQGYRLACQTYYEEDSSGFRVTYWF